MRLLMIGYGNPGRGDDGLGPALAEALEADGLPGLDITVDFQLNVENAFDLEGYDTVYFIDAAVEGPEPFDFHRIQPSDPPLFSSHAVSPEGVLALADKLFGLKVPGYVMAVRGYEFDEFGAAISGQASSNLSAATAFMRQHLGQRLIKTLHAAEGIRDLLKGPALQGTDLVARETKTSEGAGIIEAPRGTLLHH